MHSLLSIGLDYALVDVQSPAAQRQRAYYSGWRADIIVLGTGASSFVEIAPQLHVHVTGGKNRVDAFFRGMSLAKKLCSQQRVDVVTAQDPLWCGLLGYMTACRAHAAFHLQDHSGFFSRNIKTFTEKLLTPVANFLARRARRIRTVSRRGEKGILSLGVSVDRIDVIPIATNTQVFLSVEPAHSALHVLCVARLEWEKGVDVLLDAWSSVIARVPEARLRIAGDGSQREELEKKCIQLKISSSVEFVGRRGTIVDDLAWSSVVVQPSRFEGWGMAVIEAAAAGRPVIMTEVGCAGEVIVHDQTGLVVPIDRSDLLADATIDLLTHPARAQMLGEAARERVSALPTVDETAAAIRSSLERSVRSLRVLVVTQAVDRDDPVLGFFHGWLKEFAKQAEQVTVICLREGAYDLPSNIRVYSLGKEKNANRASYLFHFFTLIWRERASYDVVFVHMNELYVLLAGMFWRVWGKRIDLWRNHPRGTWMTPLAARIANKVYYTSPYSFTARYPHARRMPAGIDTNIFSPRMNVERQAGEILFLGRLSPIKHPEVLLAALQRMWDAGSRDWSVRFVGDAPARDEVFAATFREKVQASLFRDRIQFVPGVSSEKTPEIFSRADIYVNTTPAGSFDKTCIEAMACGCFVVVGRQNFAEEIDPVHLFTEHDPDDLARVLKQALALTTKEKERQREALRRYAVERHDLYALIRQIIEEGRL